MGYGLETTSMKSKKRLSSLDDTPDAEHSNKVTSKRMYVHICIHTHIHMYMYRIWRQVRWQSGSQVSHTHTPSRNLSFSVKFAQGAGERSLPQDCYPRLLRLSSQLGPPEHLTTTNTHSRPQEDPPSRSRISECPKSCDPNPQAPGIDNGEGQRKGDGQPQGHVERYLASEQTLFYMETPRQRSLEQELSLHKWDYASWIARD